MTNPAYSPAPRDLPLSPSASCPAPPGTRKRSRSSVLISVRPAVSLTATRGSCSPLGPPRVGWRAFDRCRSILRAYEGRVRWPLTALTRRYLDDQRTLRIARGHCPTPATSSHSEGKGYLGDTVVDSWVVPGTAARLGYPRP